MNLQVFEFKKYLMISLIPLLLLTIWISAIFSTFLQPLSKSFYLTSLFFMKIFSSVCHQDPEKSVLMGKHIFVCARCAGIYTGGFIVSLMLLCGMAIKTRKMKLLLISSVIIISDVLLYNAGFYKYYNLLSFFTGLFFGISVYLVFISEISIFINKRRRDE